MRWEKKGVIFRVDNDYPWMSHHACVPIADKISDDVLRIDGAIIAQNGRTGRFYYAPPNLQSNAQKCGNTVLRQKITLYGAIVSDLRYGFGYTDGTGYQERDIIYDSNLLFNAPPSFPLTTDQYTLVSWTEVQ